VEARDRNQIHREGCTSPSLTHRPYSIWINVDSDTHPVIAPSGQNKRRPAQHEMGAPVEERRRTRKRNRETEKTLGITATTAAFQSLAAAVAKD
jgi:hypothetical protein